jgi:hypothetical protein
MSSAENRTFKYRGYSFQLSAARTEQGLYQAQVFHQSGLDDTQPVPLPYDTEGYGSAQEAWRHAEQQAVRWVHDRTGDGQGQF